MNLFIAIFEAAIPNDVLAAVRATYSDDNVYSISETVLLIRTKEVDNPTLISKSLSLGGTPEAPHTGMVLKLNGSHSGWYYNAFWEWLREAIV